MPRRRRQDHSDAFAELLIEVATRNAKIALPVGFVLLVMSFGLIWVAPALLGAFTPLIGLMLGIVALPVVFAAGAALLASIIRRERAAGTFRDAWAEERVRALSWKQFESLIADHFIREGYSVEERGLTTAGSRRGDGGVDLVLTHPMSPGASHLVQCKRWNAYDVGVPEIRDFVGAMVDCKTKCEGIFVTCGRFSGPAREYAADKPIRLIDGSALLSMLNAHNDLTPTVTVEAPASVVRASSPSAAPFPQAPRLPPPAHSDSNPANPPACPVCNRPMVLRVAGRGARQGKSFWGCTQYPRCRGIINIQ